MLFYSGVCLLVLLSCIIVTGQFWWTKGNVYETCLLRHSLKSQVSDLLLHTLHFLLGFTLNIYILNVNVIHLYLTFPFTSHLLLRLLQVQTLHLLLRHNTIFIVKALALLLTSQLDSKHLRYNFCGTQVYL